MPARDDSDEHTLQLEVIAMNTLDSNEHTPAGGDSDEHVLQPEV